MEKHAPDNVRERLDDALTADGATRRKDGVSDEEWELRVALGVGVSGGQ